MSAECDIAVIGGGIVGMATARALSADRRLKLTVLEAERDGTRVWQPTQPGVTLRDVPDAPRQADTPVRRLAQMRSRLRRVDR